MSIGTRTSITESGKLTRERRDCLTALRGSSIFHGARTRDVNSTWKFHYSVRDSPRDTNAIYKIILYLSGPSVPSACGQRKQPRHWSRRILAGNTTNYRAALGVLRLSYLEGWLVAECSTARGPFSLDSTSDLAPTTLLPCSRISPCRVSSLLTSTREV